MSVIEDNFSVSLPLLCVTWETERPSEQRTRRSPVFIFKNCEWYLEFTLNNNYGLTLGDTYDLHVVLAKEQQFSSEFMVETHVLNPEETTNPLICKRDRYTFPIQLITWFSVSEIKKCIPNFETKGILRIECLFEEIDSYTQSFKSGGQQSVHFPLKVESLLSSSECPSSTTGNQNFSLESLSKDLETLLDNKTLPDVQMMVEETSIPCHRAVLTARSSVFAAMFLNKMTESASGVLEIKDIDVPTAEIFLKYLYSGKISNDLTEEMFMNLFETSDKYEVNALKKVCSNELMKNINDENCLSYLSLAEAHSDQEFKDAVADYIIKDDTLIVSQNWIQFSSENLKLANEVYRKYVEKKVMKKK